MMTDENDVKKSGMNYPGNTHKDREAVTPNEPKKVIAKVIQGEAVQRKKPLGRRIADTFTGEDMHSVGSYILFDVLIPAAKAMFSDAISQGAERVFFGESRPRQSRSRDGGYTSYNRMHSSSGRRSSEEPRHISSRARATHDFGEVVLDTRGEAEEVLDSLQALVDQFELATVSDLYELVGITGSFTDNKWGWTDLRGAGIRRVREGYLLDLPRTAPID